MGAKESKSQSLQLGIIDGSWSKIGDHSMGQIYKNQDGREGAQYKYTLENKYDTAQEIILFEQRATAQLPLIKTYAYNIDNSGGFLKPENRLRVMTERIRTITLCPQLSFPEILYTLNCSLIGYQHLYNKVGPFYVNSDMLGFTNQGHAKVWLNENFGHNHPSHPQHMLMSTLPDKIFKQDTETGRIVRADQATVVRNVCNVIEDRCQQGRFPQYFQQKIHESGIGFPEALQIIHDTVSQHNLYLPTYVDLYGNLIKAKSSAYRQNKTDIINQFPSVFPQKRSTFASSQIIKR